MQVTTAMLADNAVEAGGKVYIHGGAWDMLTVAEVPTQQQMALVVVFQLDWGEAQQDIPFTVELLDEDLRPVGVEGRGRLRAGHGPYAEPGDPAAAAFVAQFNPLPLPKAGAYRFRIETTSPDGNTQETFVPFRVRVETPLISPSEPEQPS